MFREKKNKRGRDNKKSIGEEMKINFGLFFLQKESVCIF